LNSSVPNVPSISSNHQLPELIPLIGEIRLTSQLNTRVEWTDLDRVTGDNYLEGAIVAIMLNLIALAFPAIQFIDPLFSAYLCQSCEITQVEKVIILGNIVTIRHDRDI